MKNKVFPFVTVLSPFHSSTRKRKKVWLCLPNYRLNSADSWSQGLSWLEMSSVWSLSTLIQYRLPPGQGQPSLDADIFLATLAWMIHLDNLIMKDCQSEVFASHLTGWKAFGLRWQLAISHPCSLTRNSPACMPTSTCVSLRIVIGWVYSLTMLLAQGPFCLSDSWRSADGGAGGVELSRASWAGCPRWCDE